MDYIGILKEISVLDIDPNSRGIRMIFQVQVYDEFAFMVEEYRIGAWNLDHAEDYVVDRMVRTYGENSPNFTFHLFAQDGVSYFVESAEIDAARDEFFQSLGLDTPAPVC